MSNPRSASNAWSNIKKKLWGPSDKSVKSATLSAKSTPKSGAGRKRKASNSGRTDVEGDAADEERTPSKKPRKTPAKKAKKATPTARVNNADDIADDTTDDTAHVKSEATAHDSDNIEAHVNMSDIPDATLNLGISKVTENEEEDIEATLANEGDVAV
jgi:hypothetical protein